MKLSENIIFTGALLLVVSGGLVFYSIEYTSEKEATKTTITSTTSTTASTSTTSSTETSTSTTQEEVASTSTSSMTTSTSTTTTTTIQKSTYLDRYAGKGYRQAFLDIQYFCPSCVPAVAQNVQHEPGVMGKSIGYRQEVSWVVYDPKVVDLERIVELAASSGGAQVINDTAI
ncbi:MAG: hypothetical protein V1744_05195 [Candidatus Altiarchaeota archaeon]